MIVAVLDTIGGSLLVVVPLTSHANYRRHANKSARSLWDNGSKLINAKTN